MFRRSDITFESSGEKCAAWIYEPSHSTGPHKALLMAHGLGAVKENGLDCFASHFAQEGFLVMVFDYRGFGGSEGRVRDLINPWRQINDWKAALVYLRGREDVDTHGIHLWGTSFSGGHVLSVAASDSSISSVIAQVPAVDGWAITRNTKFSHVIKASLLGYLDLLRRYIFLGDAVRVPLAGPPERFAIINRQDWKKALRLYSAGQVQRIPMIPSLIFWALPFYRPIRRAKQIKCPVLIIGATADNLIPIDSVEEAAGRIPRCRFIKLAIEHFDPYFDEHLALVLREETRFLRDVAEKAI